MISARERHKPSCSMRESKSGAKGIYSINWVRALTHRMWAGLGWWQWCDPVTVPDEVRWWARAGVQLGGDIGLEARKRDPRSNQGWSRKPRQPVSTVGGQAGCRANYNTGPSSMQETWLGTAYRHGTDETRILLDPWTDRAWLGAQVGLVRATKPCWSSQGPDNIFVFLTTSGSDLV